MERYDKGRGTGAPKQGTKGNATDTKPVERKPVEVSRKAYVAVFIVVFFLLFGLCANVFRLFRPRQEPDISVLLQDAVDSFEFPMWVPEDSVTLVDEVDSLATTTKSDE